MGDSSPEPTNLCYTTSRGLDYTLHLGLWPRRSTPVHQSTTTAYQWLARLATRVFRFPDLASVFLTVGDVSVMCLLLLGPATYVHTSIRLHRRHPHSLPPSPSNPDPLILTCTVKSS